MLKVLRVKAAEEFCMNLIHKANKKEKKYVKDASPHFFNGTVTEMALSSAPDDPLQ